MAYPVISLTTDFGLKDPYVAEMKAVILDILPEARIVDVSHEITKFDVRMGAFVLASTSTHFPIGTIHVAVVDPGVGTKRRALLLQTKKAFFIGPDNGLLALAAKKQGIEHAYEITNRKYMLPEVSKTFHGRDIFAPAAANLARGTKPERFGAEICRIVSPSFARIIRKKKTVVGEVLHVDDFGNLITNLRRSDLESIGVKERVEISLRNTKLKLEICDTYREMGRRKPSVIIGSHDFMEISMNQGNAAQALDIESGERVVIHKA